MKRYLENRNEMTRIRSAKDTFDRYTYENMLVRLNIVFVYLRFLYLFIEDIYNFWMLFRLWDTEWVRNIFIARHFDFALSM